MKTTSELEQILKATGAYKNLQGKKAIDEALPKMYVAETAQNTDEVNALRQALTRKLEEILATLVPALPPESKELLRDFEAQFGQRFTELDAFGIIDKANPKIKAIDNKEYPAPSWERIKAGFTPEKMRLISQLENPTLLLVPDGMSLNEYMTKAGKAKTGSNKRQLPWNIRPDVNLNGDKAGKFISDATQYGTTAHGGKTKAERLKERGALGWQVLVVDGGDEVPTNTLNKSADTLVDEFRKAGFGGLSTEAYFALQMHGQCRGKQFDIQNWGWLLESYLTTLGNRGVVLNSDWRESCVNLNRNSPSFSLVNLGARRSIRIL